MSVHTDPGDSWDCPVPLGGSRATVGGGGQEPEALGEGKGRGGWHGGARWHPGTVAHLEDGTPSSFRWQWVTFCGDSLAMRECGLSEGWTVTGQEGRLGAERVSQQGWAACVYREDP